MSDRLQWGFTLKKQSRKGESAAEIRPQTNLAFCEEFESFLQKLRTLFGEIHLGMGTSRQPHRALVLAYVMPRDSI